VYVQLMAEDGEESDPQRICGEAAARLRLVTIPALAGAPGL